jgi:hypothetical protein
MMGLAGKRVTAGVDRDVVPNSILKQQAVELANDLAIGQQDLKIVGSAVYNAAFNAAEDARKVAVADIKREMLQPNRFQTTIVRILVASCYAAIKTAYNFITAYETGPFYNVPLFYFMVSPAVQDPFATLCAGFYMQAMGSNNVSQMTTSAIADVNSRAAKLIEQNGQYLMSFMKRLKTPVPAYPWLARDRKPSPSWLLEYWEKIPPDRVIKRK